ncbi:MAG: ParB/RepB/Spo0J family partition protein [Candidatus Moraniibacteriota bacterium]
MAQQYGLGRGLASLIPPKKIPTDTPSVDPLPEMAVSALPPATDSHPDVPLTRVIPISDIVPNPHQPRLHFDETKLSELADSIREHGILQPLIVSPLGDGKYELIAGERRLQAAKQAGLATVPVVVREAGNQEKLELAIIENIQRHDLNPIEEAKAYLRLTDEFGLHQDEVAKKMGKSRPVVSNTMRLLILPVEIQRAIIEGKISEGHAKALLSIENPEKQRALFDLILKDELTVRETEDKAREVSVRSHLRTARDKAPELAAKEEWLTEQLGTKVKIQTKGKGGKITIEFYSNEELNGILGRLA